MNSRYVIQLRSPWELSSPAADTDSSLPDTRRVRIPIDLRTQIPPLTEGIITISRRFHPPRTLDEGEKVFCRLVDIPGLIELRLNGQLLPFEMGQASLIEFDISRLMQPNNLLELSFSLTEGSPAEGSPERPVGILGVVTLQFGRE